MSLRPPSCCFCRHPSISSETSVCCLQLLISWWRVGSRNSSLLLWGCFSLQLSAIDVSARTTMKGAANCDKHCELQNSVNHQIFERTLRPGAFPRACLFERQRTPQALLGAGRLSRHRRGLAPKRLAAGPEVRSAADLHSRLAAFPQKRIFLV